MILGISPLGLVPLGVGPYTPRLSFATSARSRRLTVDLSPRRVIVRVQKLEARMAAISTIKQPYPFDRKDQLEFEWEFTFPDSDTVASYTLDPDAGVLVVADGRSGNVVRALVDVNSSVTLQDWAEVGIACEMTSSSSPPRKVRRTITLQILPL
jgi:hypothetical protein